MAAPAPTSLSSILDALNAAPIEPVAPNRRNMSPARAKLMSSKNVRDAVSGGDPRSVQQKTMRKRASRYQSKSPIAYSGDFEPPTRKFTFSGEALSDADHTKHASRMSGKSNYLRKTLTNKDASQSGHVNFDEFKAAMVQADMKLNPDEVKQVFDIYATEGKRRAAQEAQAAQAQAQAPVPAAPTESSQSQSQSQSQQMTQPNNYQLRGTTKQPFLGVLGSTNTVHIDNFLTDIKNRGDAASADAQKSREKRRVFNKVLHRLNQYVDGEVHASDVGRCHPSSRGDI